MHDSSRNIKKVLLQMQSMLLSRYGRSEACTKAQVDLTISEMNMPEFLRPYAYCAFMNETDLGTIKSLIKIDWPSIERVATESLLADADFNGDAFHESWKGINGL